MFLGFDLARLKNGSLRPYVAILLWSFMFAIPVLFFGWAIEDGFRKQPYLLEAIAWFLPLVLFLLPRVLRALWRLSVKLVNSCIGWYSEQQIERQKAFELKLGRYNPLDASIREIRLVAIMPGSASEQIECALKPISLDEKAHFIPFVALSYTWGNPFRTRNILLDGEPCKVRTNLYSALRQLRLPDKTRFIWIDALCINQCDSTERNQQVSIMRYIYRASFEVLVWLGDGDKTSRLAFEFFELAEEQGHMDSFIKASIGNDRYKLAWQAIRILFKRDYWKRVWIIQEIAAGSSVIVHCGSDTVSWRTLAMCDAIWQALAPSSIAKFPQWFRAVDKEEKGPLRVLNGSQGPSTLDAIRNNFHSNHRSHPDLLELFTGFPNSPRNTIMELLQLSSISKATNPKDYIYALVGLASDCQSPEFAIDYNLELDEVHQSLVDYMKEKTGRIDILGFSGVAYMFDHGTEGGSWSRENGSWLPTRGSATHSKLQLSRINLHDRFSADGGRTNARLEVEPSGYLSQKRVLVAGCTVSALWKLGPKFKNQSSSYFSEKDLQRVTKDICAAFTFAKSMLTEAEKHNSVYSTLCSRMRSNLQNFWRVLVCDRTIDGLEASDDWEAKFNAITDDSLSHEDENFTRPYLYAVLYYMCDRQLFITEDGDFGVGPSSLSTKHESDKDDIIVLLGCNVPMARKKYWYDSSLKKKGNYVRQPSQDHLLGWVYLQNYMTGKALEEVYVGGKRIETFSLI